MLNPHFPSETTIIEFLNFSYGIEATSITPLSGGADINAALYKVLAQDQASYFVKLKRNYKSDNALELLELLHASGIKEIIPPIQAVCKCLITPIIDNSLIVYPFIEGVNGFSHKLTDTQWITLGKALRQVHDFDVPSSLRKHIRKETYSPESRQAVRSLLANIQDEPATDDAIAQKFLHFIKEHKSVITRLVDRAEQLCAVIKDQPAKFVLCHSDIHAGNVLICENNAIYIVDWDEPIMAPKERDLMFIGSSVGNVWNDPQEEVSFYEGYGTTDINRAILAYYRYERIVQDIAEYSEILLLPNDDNIRKDRSEIYEQFAGMFDPQGVVVVAFKTDKMNQV